MRKSDLPEIPAALADVALIDDKQFAATMGVSVSQLRELVRQKIAPPPVIQRHRFTRWQQGAVRKFLIDFAANSSPAQAGQSASNA